MRAGQLNYLKNKQNNNIWIKDKKLNKIMQRSYHFIKNVVTHVMIGLGQM